MRNRNNFLRIARFFGSKKTTTQTIKNETHEVKLHKQPYFNPKANPVLFKNYQQMNARIKSIKPDDYEVIDAGGLESAMREAEAIKNSYYS